MHPQDGLLLQRQPRGGHPVAQPVYAVGRISLLVLIGVLLMCTSGSPFSVAHAKDCVTRGPEHMSVWKHKEGSFQCSHCIGDRSTYYQGGAKRRQWTEYNKDRRPVNTFVEGHRDDGQVVLVDENRGVSILLRHDLSGIRNEGEENFRQLYPGSFISVVDCT